MMEKYKPESHMFEPDQKFDCIKCSLPSNDEVHTGFSDSQSMTTEAQTQKAVLDYLAAKRIWHMRCNTGAMQAEHNGKKRFLRFGKPGMADVLAMVPHVEFCRLSLTVWLEIKSPTGKQSAAQKEFQAEVEAEGHTYLLVRDIDEVREFFGG